MCSVNNISGSESPRDDGWATRPRKKIAKIFKRFGRRFGRPLVLQGRWSNDFCNFVFLVICCAIFVFPHPLCWGCKILVLSRLLLLRVFLRHYATVLHLLTYLQGPLRLLALLQGTDQAAANIVSGVALVGFALKCCTC